jgi:hypothetical protein
MKYRPEFPDRFGCYENALAFCRFSSWYNDQDWALPHRLACTF